jgi:hypothetical protein
MSLRSPGWPETLDRPASASQVASQVVGGTTVSGSFLFCFGAGDGTQGHTQLGGQAGDVERENSRQGHLWSPMMAVMAGQGSQGAPGLPFQDMVLMPGTTKSDPRGLPRSLSDDNV